MNTNQTQCADAKELFEAVQRQPAEAQQAILTMLRGAIVISEMYGRDSPSPGAERPSA